MDLIEKARVFATLAHHSQKRKYTGDPYIVHPTAVAKKVDMAQGTDEMIAAAYLHDVVEDTEFGHESIERLFGPVVAEYVYWLTDISKPEDGNRKKRKQMDREHIAKAPDCVKTIKVADLLHNTESITEHDKDFAVVYMKEKALLLKEALVGAHEGLVALAELEIMTWEYQREVDKALK